MIARSRFAAPVARALQPARTTLSLVIAALCLGGCAATFAPAPQAVADAALTRLPELAPATSATLRDDLAIDRWWTQFGDADLNRLMDEALSHNEDLESATAAVREAQAALNAARGAQTPSVDAELRSARALQSRIGATPLPPGTDRLSSSHRAALTASYEVDLWGRLSAATADARAQLLASEWARRTVEWGLTARLAEAYFGLAAVCRQIEISEAVRAGRETTYQLRRRELEAGAGNEFELRRTEAELIAAESTLIGLGRQQVALARALTALLGRTPQEIVHSGLSGRMLDEREPLATVLPRGAAADLLVLRPDIRQAEARLAAANASIEAARAATLPSIRLSGSLGHDARELSSLLSGPAFLWSLAASATQAIFDGGRAQARVSAEHARAEQALADYRKTVAGAVLDVVEAYGNLDLTDQAFRADRARAAALGRARELARHGYGNGALNHLDLLDAERNWYQAQLQQVTSYRDQLVAQVAAFKALGGGYALAATESPAPATIQ